ncbi:MAG TPA: glutamyl-tRNA reductase [Pseudolysinimonas sp.]|nr:glutamyl-tRNA reductase [Pseudolysinimonas sp.]
MLLCVTANHRTADFELLDRVSRGASSVAGDLVTGSDVVAGAVVLATCNRFEAYLEIDEPLTAAVEVATEVVFATLAASLGDDAGRLRDAAAVHAGPAVARHLFAVTSGLESLVLGEDEIAGQVQRALAAAREAGTSSGGLERLFQRATRTSREVRAAADLGGAGRTVARLALDLASTRVADWSATTVLVVGTGSYAATTITALRARGVTDLRVFSATGRAERFAARFGVRAEHDLGAAIADAGVVITCTARYEVTAADIPDERRRLIIDLGLPRNVRPEVGALPGVELIDLEVLALHAPLPELEPGARELVGSAADAFAAEELAAPAIVALRSHVFAALEAELARSRARGEDERTEQALRHFAGVLLHEPSVRARDLAAQGRSEEFAAALRVLYGVEAEVTPPPRRRGRPSAG